MAEKTTEIWSDLHQSIGPDSHGALKKVINVESVRTSIDNILGTFQGERIMLPEFGSNLRGFLFEPINQRLVNRLSNEIKDKIEIWDNRVEVIGVDFKTDPDNNYISITVSFNIRSYTETFNYTTTVTQ